MFKIPISFMTIYNYEYYRYQSSSPNSNHMLSRRFSRWFLYKVAMIKDNAMPKSTKIRFSSGIRIPRLSVCF